MIVAYIDAHKAAFGVEQICRVLTEHGITISPSTYYARCVSPVTEAELEDAYAAHEVFSPVPRPAGPVRGAEAVAQPSPAGP